VIAQEPKVLLLDEPTSALDIHHQVKFFELLTGLIKGGMAVAVVTHDLNLASLFSDRLLLLKGGQIIHQGNPEKILDEEILRRTYGKGLEIVRHPTTGNPVVLPTTSRESHREGTP
jgi:iron complex transport system ATP-binding protein